jgi:hypothetical protein
VLPICYPGSSKFGLPGRPQGPAKRSRRGTSVA